MNTFKSDCILRRSLTVLLGCSLWSKPQRWTSRLSRRECADSLAPAGDTSRQGQNTSLESSLNRQVPTPESLTSAFSSRRPSHWWRADRRYGEGNKPQNVGGRLNCPAPPTAFTPCAPHTTQLVETISPKWQRSLHRCSTVRQGRCSVQKFRTTTRTHTFYVLFVLCPVRKRILLVFQ